MDIDEDLDLSDFDLDPANAEILEELSEDIVKYQCNKASMLFFNEYHHTDQGGEGVRNLRKRCSALSISLLQEATEESSDAATICVIHAFLIPQQKAALRVSFFSVPCLICILEMNSGGNFPKFYLGLEQGCTLIQKH